MNSLVKIKRQKDGKTITEAYLVKNTVNQADIEAKVTEYLTKRGIHDFGIPSTTQLPTQILGGRKPNINELREVNATAKDLKSAVGSALAVRVVRTWKEPFIDEDTGENVSIDRSEVILTENTIIDDDAIGVILDSDKIQSIFVHVPEDVVYVFQVGVEYVHDEQKKSPMRKTYLLFANSLEDATTLTHDDLYEDIDCMEGYTAEIIGLTRKPIVTVIS